MAGVKPVAFAALSAVLFAAALPNEVANYGVPALGLVALIPLYAALREANEMRVALWVGGVYGALSTVLSNYWLANFGELAVWTLGGPTVAYAVYNMLLAAVLRTLMRLPDRLRPPAFAAAWTGYELLKSIGYLGHPWGLAAYSFGGVLRMQQIADITGVYGLSFVIVYANAVLAEIALYGASLRVRESKPRRVAAAALRARPIRCLVPAIALFTAIAVYGEFQLTQRRAPVDEIRAVLVQQNTDSWRPGNLDAAVSVLQRLSAAALADGEHDLLVWSENSLSLPYREHRGEFYAQHPQPVPLTEFIASLEVPLLTGSPYLPREFPEEVWNAVVLIEPGTGDLLERYGKRRLVPFAEHIPLWEFAPVRTFFRNVVGLRTVWSRADETVLFEVPTRQGSAKAGVPISFEGAFAPLTRDFTRAGAQLLINMTNNSWSQTESAQYQQFVVTRFRAIEARRPLLLATISGLTSAVDITGEKLVALPMFEEGALEATAPIYESSSFTVYHRIGDLFAWLMVATTVLLTVKAAPKRPGAA